LRRPDPARALSAEGAGTYVEGMALPADESLLERIWQDLGGCAPALAGVRFSGPKRLLPSVYDVSAFAAATIAAALGAVAEVDAVRRDDRPRDVLVDRAHASVAFRSERYQSGSGWKMSSPWDPIAGDYAANDGWIRLHTNYRNHREAALRVLGAGESRDQVAAAVASWACDDLESAVVSEGGCAARLRTAAEWAAHPQGAAVRREPLAALSLHDVSASAPALPPPAGAPLEGIRVLDLTRVIAGPVCTRWLAAYGAQVLRIDPPGFDEGETVLCDTTVGKRRASLDLRAPSDRATLERLLAQAHVLVHGYRPDALERLGLGGARRRELNPVLVDASLDAYGWTGPWAHRRGFDSLVQMSAGIAARGQQVAGSAKPVPLPAQALDHGTGYLLAAAVCRALSRLFAERRASTLRLSLARTAALLVDLDDGGDPSAPDIPAEEADRWCEPASTGFGDVRRVRCPGGIDGVEPRWAIDAGPLGTHAPALW
jgi:hypothetical protein